MIEIYGKIYYYIKLMVKYIIEIDGKIKLMVKFNIEIDLKIQYKN